MKKRLFSRKLWGIPIALVLAIVATLGVGLVGGGLYATWHFNSSLSNSAVQVIGSSLTLYKTVACDVAYATNDSLAPFAPISTDFGNPPFRSATVLTLYAKNTGNAGALNPQIKTDLATSGFQLDGSNGQITSTYSPLIPQVFTPTSEETIASTNGVDASQTSIVTGLPSPSGWSAGQYCKWGDEIIQTTAWNNTTGTATLIRGCCGSQSAIHSAGTLQFGTVSSPSLGIGQVATITLNLAATTAQAGSSSGTFNVIIDCNPSGS